MVSTAGDGAIVGGRWEAIYYFIAQAPFYWQLLATQATLQCTKGRFIIRHASQLYISDF